MIFLGYIKITLETGAFKIFYYAFLFETECLGIVHKWSFT